MSLKQVVEQIIADAFLAGAEWYAIQSGQDSAVVGRQVRTWQTDGRYQTSLKRQQVAAAEAVARAIMRLTLGPRERQGTLFGGDAS